MTPTLLLAEGDHVEIGTRQMNEDAIAQIEIERAKPAEEEDCLEGEEMTSGFIFDRYPAVYFPASTHWLSAVSGLGDTVELEDGSVWKINSYDSYKALNWRSNDPLAITQNNRWFSSFNYRIINKNTGASIEGNLFLGPVEKGPHTRYIVAIDKSHKEIQLSDNTRWEISYLDSSIFKDWALGDAIVIGVNSGWDSGSEALLVNVNMNNCSRAKQF